MRLLLIKERLFLFGEFAVSKSQYLYNNNENGLSDSNYGDSEIPLCPITLTRHVQLSLVASIELRLLGN